MIGWYLLKGSRPPFRLFTDAAGFSASCALTNTGDAVIASPRRRRLKSVRIAFVVHRLFFLVELSTLLSGRPAVRRGLRALLAVAERPAFEASRSKRSKQSNQSELPAVLFAFCLSNCLISKLVIETMR